MTKETLGIRLLRAREAKKLTQIHVAEKLGASQQSISQWEHDI